MASLSISRKPTARPSPANEVEALSDDDVAELLHVASFDEYADFAWSGASLDVLCERLAARMSAARREVESAVVYEIRKPAVETWMSALIEARLETSRSYCSARRLLRIATRAREQGAFLVFEGD